MLENPAYLRLTALSTSLNGAHNCYMNYNNMAPILQTKTVLFKKKNAILFV